MILALCLGCEAICCKGTLLYRLVKLYSKGEIAASRGLFYWRSYDSYLYLFSKLSTNRLEYFSVFKGVNDFLYWNGTFRVKIEQTFENKQPSSVGEWLECLCLPVVVEFTEQFSISGVARLSETYTANATEQAHLVIELVGYLHDVSIADFVGAGVTSRRVRWIHYS